MVQQSISAEDTLFIRKQLEQILPRATALVTRGKDASTTVEIFLLDSTQVKKAKNLCEGYFGVSAELNHGPLPTEKFEAIITGRSTATAAEISEGMPAVSFLLKNEAAEKFLKEFGTKMMVITRDASTLEPLRGDEASWNQPPSPAWQSYLDAREEAKNWLPRLETTLGRVESVQKAGR